MEKKLKDPKRDISTEFHDLSQRMQQGIEDILEGKVVGRQIFHIWYDEELSQQAVYQGVAKMVAPMLFVTGIQMRRKHTMTELIMIYPNMHWQQISCVKI